MSKLSAEEQKAAERIVRNINANNERKLAEALDPKGIIQKELLAEKAKGYKRTGEAGWVKIAHIPTVVDKWFTQMYGKDYYKEKGFFDKHPEWRTINISTEKI